MSKKVFIFFITTSLLFFRAILSSKIIMSKRLPFNPELSMTAVSKRIIIITYKLVENITVDLNFFTNI